MVRILGAPSDKAQHVTKPPEKDPFEVVSQEDLYKADEQLTKEILTYAGYTALTVVVFLIIVACFATDPRACIIAFGTGSPCCLLCPCISNLYKYTDPAKIIKDGANKYVPGIVVGEDGKVEMYEPNTEETDLLYELINEFMTIS